jgi:hypothetical protein
MVFGTFGEMSSNVKDFVDLAMDYGAEHLGKSKAALTLDTLRQALKPRYRAQLSMASWRGYANLILDHTKYVGEGIEGLMRDHIRLGMYDKADLGEFDSLFLAHEKIYRRGYNSKGIRDFVPMYYYYGQLYISSTGWSISCNSYEFKCYAAYASVNTYCYA